jgi:hypothetical protein
MSLDISIYTELENRLNPLQSLFGQGKIENSHLQSSAQNYGSNLDNAIASLRSVGTDNARNGGFGSFGNLAALYASTNLGYFK